MNFFDIIENLVIKLLIKQDVSVNNYYLNLNNNFETPKDTLIIISEYVLTIFDLF